MFKFFVMPYYVPDNYSPEAIALAEGILALKHDIGGNVNYWLEPKSQKYLIEEKSDDAPYEVGIFDYKYLYHSKTWTLRRLDRSKFNVLIDRNDWLWQQWRSPEVLEAFDLILIDHYVEGFSYPANVRPWSIGLTQRVISYLDALPATSSEKTRESIASNFRVGHNLRSLLKKDLDEDLSSRFEIVSKILNYTTSHDDSDVDGSYWKQTARRHNPAYYKLLNESSMTYAFGGYFEYLPKLTQPYDLWDKLQRRPNIMYSKLLRAMGKDHAPAHFVFQYDSFRFWESMYSQSCPIHLHFDDWGFVLPEQPKHREHYLGIQGFDTQGFAQEVLSLSAKEIVAIGKAGKAWAFDKYRPQAVAQRLLDLIAQYKT